MAKQKKDFSLIIWAFGWLLDVATRLRKIIQETELTFEAFERLGSDAGEATLRRIVHVIYVDHLAHLERIRLESLPKLNPNPAMSGFVDVPDLPLNELIALAERELGVPSSSPSFGTAALHGLPYGHIAVDGRGKRYEYRWMFMKEFPARLEPELERQLNTYNPAVFLAWLIQEKPKGTYEYAFLGYRGEPEARRLFVIKVGDCTDAYACSLVCHEVPKT